MCITRRLVRGLDSVLTAPYLQCDPLSLHASVNTDKHKPLGVIWLSDNKSSRVHPQMNPTCNLCWVGIPHLQEKCNERQTIMYVEWDTANIKGIL